jgi:uncharacterized small protein (DUF1192 family)
MTDWCKRKGGHLLRADGRCTRVGCDYHDPAWTAPPSTMPQAAPETEGPDADRLTLSRLAGAADGAVGAMLGEALRVRDQHRAQIDALKARVVELEARVVALKAEVARIRAPETVPSALESTKPARWTPVDPQEDGR